MRRLPKAAHLLLKAECLLKARRMPLPKLRIPNRNISTPQASIGPTLRRAGGCETFNCETAGAASGPPSSYATSHTPVVYNINPIVTLLAFWFVLKRQGGAAEIKSSAFKSSVPVTLPWEGGYRP